MESSRWSCHGDSWLRIRRVTSYGVIALAVSWGFGKLVCDFPKKGVYWLLKMVIRMVGWYYYKMW
jgi:hypothetical protein